MDPGRRRDAIGVIGSLLVIAITAGLIVLVNSGRTAERVQPVDPVEVVAPDATMLLQFRDEDAVVGSLIVSGGASVAMLALPETLLIPTPQLVPLANAPQERDTLAARNGVSALLGVRLDAVLTLDRLALTGLIDAVGGAPLDIPARFVERDSTGAAGLAIFPGARVLPGTSAAAYAMGDGEPRAERLQRLATVMGQVLVALPRDADALRALLVSLGASARSSAGADATAGTLARVVDSVDGGIVMQALPVTDLVGGIASRPSEPEASAIVRALLPNALLAAGQSPLPRIVLRRAGASIGDVLATQDALAAASMAVVTVEPAVDSTAVPRVLVPDGSAEAIARGIDVATVLDLPATAVGVSEDPLPLPQPDAIVLLTVDIG